MPDVVTYGGGVADPVDGLIYSVGGSDSSLAYGGGQQVFVYDPKTNVWSAGPGMNSERRFPSVAVASDGKIYAAGGTSDSEAFVSSGEVYDPTARTWTLIPGVPGGRRGGAAVVGKDGRFYVIGGDGPTGTSLANEAYSPSTNSWAELAPLPAGGGFGVAAVTDSTGLIYVVGSQFDPGYSPVTYVYVYNPDTNTWTQGPSLPGGGRFNLSLARGHDGLIYAIGGGNAATDAVDILNPATGVWAAGPSLPRADEGSGAAVAPDGRVFTFGGAIGYGDYPASSTLYLTPASGPTPPPAQAILDNPADNSIINNPHPVVSGTAEPDSTVGVFDGGAPIGSTAASSAGFWSLPVTLSDGIHTLTATATNTAGLTSAASNTARVTVDTVAPNAPLITEPVNGALTNSAVPIINGSAEPGSAVTVLDGSAVLGTTRAASTSDSLPGTWSITIASKLVDGTHQLSATATDDASNISPLSTSRSITVDTTAPVLSAAPNLLPFEATSPQGSTVTYAAPTATDAIAGATSVSCTPGAGTVFPLGTTTITCSSTDPAGNTASTKFDVTVVDTTAPTLIGMPPDVTYEAASANGTAVSFTPPTATDAGDAHPMVACSAMNGTVFPIGNTTVTCTATDASKNASQASFTVTVGNTAPPVFSNVPGAATIEATGPSGATYTYAEPTAIDAVDGPRPVSCTTPSGVTLSLGSHTISCSTRDVPGNTATASWSILVTDSTPPAITGTPANQHLEATGPTGAVFAYATPTGTDLVDATDTVSCTFSSGTAAPLGTTHVTCSSMDRAGNPAQTSFTITVVDTTPPTLHLPNSPVIAAATSPAGATVTYTATATDLVDGRVTPTCSQGSGTVFPIGKTTVTCTAKDKTGNLTPRESFTVQVDGAPQQLTNLITTVTGLSPTVSAGLVNKLQAAIASLSTANKTATYNQLNAFISLTAAQSGKSLTVNQASQLAQAARLIQALLT